MVGRAVDIGGASADVARQPMTAGSSLFIAHIHSIGGVVIAVSCAKSAEIMLTCLWCTKCIGAGSLGITSGTRNHIHLSKTIVNAMEAGHVRIDRPAIIEVDTVRAVADGHTIYRAGKTVFLTDEVPPEYLYRVGDDDPMIADTVARWEREEEE